MNKNFGKELLNYKDENLFSTGFEDVDTYIKGVISGTLITIGARPAMGKTSFSISILNHLLSQNKKVLLFSLAYSNSMLVRRLISIKSDICFWELDKIKEKEFERISKAIDFYKESNLYIDDKTVCTIENIEEKVKSSKPDIVFIDYIQLVETPKAPNYTDSINIAVKEIKRIARENNTIFVIISQLSRALETRLDKRPMLSDIRSSSLLPELSDIVMMIYREEYYNREDYCKNQAEIIFLKNEFGPLGFSYLNFEKGIFNNPKPIEF
ncbi:DnaB-like helicase C-terminal domain-containing protein [bacterium]|nr:DnaB-like helicase C-terminal domain-containing protein [bacterium]